MTRFCAWTAAAALILAVGGVRGADDSTTCPRSAGETLIGTALGALAAPSGCCADSGQNCCPKCCADKAANCCPECCKDKNQDCCKGKGQKSCAKCCQEKACCAGKCHKTQKEKQIEQRLNDPISCDFHDTPLSEVLDEFSDTGLNLVVDRPALEDAGISDSKRLTLALHDVSFKTALKLALQQAHLSYVIKDEVVLVTTEAAARGKLVRRVFQVADLVPDSRHKLQDVLIKLITSAIQPQTWSALGGQATIDFFPLGNALVVNQSPDVLEQIADLLGDLRRLIQSEPVAVAAPPVPSVVVLSSGDFTLPLPPPPVPPPMMAGGPPSFHANPYWSAPPGPVPPIPPAAPEPFRPGFTPDRFVSAPFGGNFFYSVVPAVATEPVNPAPYPHVFAPPPPGETFPAADYSSSGNYTPAPVLPPSGLVGVSPLGIQTCGVEAPVAPGCQGGTCAVPRPAPPAYAPPAPRGCKCCVLQVAREGKGQLEILSGCDTRLTCESLVLSVPGSDSVKVSVVSKQVQLCGAFFKAAADHVMRVSHDDALILDGHVKLDYHKDDQRANVAADHVRVGLARGHVEITSTPAAAGCCGSKAKGSACCGAPVLIRTKDADGKDVFSFWSGFSH